MTHLETQIKALTERVKNVEAELAGRKRGQKLSADDADHYEAGWKAQVDFLKEVLGEAGSFIAKMGNADPGKDAEAYEDILRRIDAACEPENEPPGMGGLTSNKPFEDFDADLTISILGLATEHEIPFETVVGWTTEQRAQAEAWAAQQHSMASDNHVPKKDRLEKPPHVVQLEEDNPKMPDFFTMDEAELAKRRYPAWKAWAERMKGFAAEWSRLHRIEEAAREARRAFRTPQRDHVMSALCRVIDAVELERVKEFRSMRGASKG